MKRAYVSLSLVVISTDINDIIRTSGATVLETDNVVFWDSNWEGGN